MGRCNKRVVLIVLLMLGFFSGSAMSQAYRWVDKDGKVRYGDVPPPGTKATPLKAPASGPAPEQPKPAAKTPAAQKDAAKAPAAQKDAAISAAQEEKERQELAARRENCARARETLAMLESGQRISRIDAKGERYFLEDAQRSQEVAKARQSMSQWCA